MSRHITNIYYVGMLFLKTLVRIQIMNDTCFTNCLTILIFNHLSVDCYLCCILIVRLHSNGTEQKRSFIEISEAKHKLMKSFWDMKYMMEKTFKMKFNVSIRDHFWISMLIHWFRENVWLSLCLVRQNA